MTETADGGKVVVVLTTAPSGEVAEALVRRLVDERLIACGNLVPGITSLYRWEGAVQREDEVLVLMKTTRPRVQRLFQRVGELHPYQVPELVALPVETVSAAYGRWVQHETIEVSA